MRKVFFRADAGAGIGYGHFIRTLALADMLNDDFDCTFFTSEPTSYQIGEMEKVCKHVVLEESTKFHTFLNYLEGDEIVVLDNYFYTTDYQYKIKEKGCKLVCIDDIPDKHYVADIIINQAINIEPEDYSCEKYTRFALGLGFSLLRRPFFDACRKKENQCSLEQKENLQIVVAFGGADYLNLTGKVIESIHNFDFIHSIKAIVGDAFSEEQMNLSPKVNFLKNLSAQEIADLFASSDVAILPASTMMNEAMACGIKIIGGYYVKNQENDYYAFMHANMIIGVGDFSEVDAMNRLRKALLRVSGRDGNNITADTPQRFVELFKSI